jgi:hypothetical protein
MATVNNDNVHWCKPPVRALEVDRLLKRVGIDSAPEVTSLVVAKLTQNANQLH